MHMVFGDEKKKWNCCKKINGTFVDTLKIIQDLYILGFRVISHEVNMNTPPLLDRYVFFEVVFMKETSLQIN